VFASESENSDGEADDIVTLDDLTVVAIKQDAALKTQPLSSTIITSAEADRLNLNTLKGVSDIIPNFYIPDYGSRITSSIYVRGLGARMDQPAVGLNVDNVPFLNKDAYDFDIANISQIEMLRGPQSTLYGRNTMGGQINITTLSPLEYSGWKLLAEIGSGRSWKVNVSNFHRFTSDMGLAVSAGYTSTKGFFRNQYNGEKIDKEHLWSARVKFDWRISRSLKLQNVFSTSGLNQGGYPYEYLPENKIAYNDTCFYRRFCFNDGLTLRLNAPSFTMTSISSVQYIKDNMTLDQDFLPIDYFTLTQKKVETGVTQDFIFRGKEQGVGYSWLAGAFAFYKHLNMKAPVTFKDYGITNLIEKHRNSSNPDYPIAWDTRSFTLNSDFTIPTYGLAIYHESNLKVSNWKFVAGVRLDYEHASLDYRSYCSTGYSIYRGSVNPSNVYRAVPVELDYKGSLSRHFLEVLPKVGVLYELPDNRSNIYINLSKGYKAGGYNTQMFSDLLQQQLMGLMGIGASYSVKDVVEYKPEKSWNYEVGSHLDLMSGRLPIDLTAFYINCVDQQLTMFPDGTTTGRIMTNAGKTRSYGFEAEVKFSATDDLMFVASYGYTNAKFKTFFDGRNDYAGKYLPYSPRNTLFLQAIYSLNLRNRSLREILFDVNLRGTGDIYWNESNSVCQPMYALLGASVDFRFSRFSVQLWGKNLTDTKYHTFYFVSIGNEFVQRGRPISVGVTFRMDI
jgi:outer membrane receptor protein involved in Fe transport